MKAFALLSLFITGAFAQTQPIQTCNPQTPTINLESEVPFPGATFRGPLAGVPQDHQDGLGTCYANTSRNILLGVSRGQDSASFLDLALMFKRQERSVGREGLDGGDVCSTLNAAKKEKYCPQNFSPLETGARSHIADLMHESTDPDHAQATIMAALRSFFQTRETFQSTELGRALLPRLRTAMARLREDPNITLPFPLTDVPFLNPGTMKGGSVDKDSVSPEVAYHEAVQRFQPQLLRAIVAGKTAEELHALYQQALDPVITQYHLHQAVVDSRSEFLARVNQQLRDPLLRQRITSTMNYLQFVTGRTTDTTDEFLNFCGTNMGEALSFYNNLQPMVQALTALNIDPNTVVDESGNAIPPEDLFQIAVAPSCVNQANRRPLAANFTCRELRLGDLKPPGLPEAQQLHQFRQTVSETLLRGIPLGRAFNQAEGASHVNSIVGMRYSSRGHGVCEYLIRDSISGESSWESERDVFGDIDSMTVVTPQP